MRDFVELINSYHIFYFILKIAIRSSIPNPSASPSLFSSSLVYSLFYIWGKVSCFYFLNTSYFFLWILFLAIFTFHMFSSWHDINVGMYIDCSGMGPFTPTTWYPWSSITPNLAYVNHRRGCVDGRLSLCRYDSHQSYNIKLSYREIWKAQNKRQWEFSRIQS
jgi:hypothetical protein